MKARTTIPAVSPAGSPAASLLALERSRFEFGDETQARKLLHLEPLASPSLRGARNVERLHELLCFLRAYPGDAAVLRKVQSMLAAFARRADLRAYREALRDSGIAGTAIHYRFFAGQAQWLAQRWPAQLLLERGDAQAEQRLAQALPVLLTRWEAHALAELKLPGYAALDRVRPKRQTDAAFLLEQIAALPGDGFTRECFSDALDLGYVLAPGADTPSRTLAHLAFAPVVLKREPPPRERPDLRAELARAPRAVRRLSLAQGHAVIELARAAMVTRARSLEAFSFADARDAWLVDDGDGLAYAFIGVVPERRHAVASYYGGLTLRNGVPIGYTQADIVGRSAALSFNTFETFRGAEAAFTFARWLAALHGVFGSESFSIEPYQLGQANDEAIESGAWWFYAKMGFAPRDANLLKLVRAEAARLQHFPKARTTPTVLRLLAQHHLFFDLDAKNPQPLPPMAALGLQAGAALSAKVGEGGREHAIAKASAMLMRQSGLPSLRGFNPAQREAWRRLAPVLVSADLAAWSAAERRALVEIIRAKAGRSERDYVAKYIAHPRLHAALLQCVRAP